MPRHSHRVYTWELTSALHSCSASTLTRRNEMSARTYLRKNSIVLPGVLSAAVYLLIFVFYIRGPQAYSRTPRELFAWFFCIALLLLFWKGYQRIRLADKPPIRTIIVCAAIFCFLAFLTFPFHSTDVFGYINRGWQQV